MSAGGSDGKPAASQPPAPEGQGDRSVLSLIRDMQAGTLVADNLTVADRRRCIEHLVIEGYTVHEIAEVLKVSERTVQRDRTAIRQENALHPRPELLGEMAGNLYRQAEATVGRLRRIARDRDTPPQVRVEAERGCFATVREAIRTFQDLGYLPSAESAIVGHLRRQAGGMGGVGGVGGAGEQDGIPNIAEVRAACVRMEAILAVNGQQDSEQARQLDKIRQDCDKLELADRLRAVVAAGAAAPVDFVETTPQLPSVEPAP